MSADFNVASPDTASGSSVTELTTGAYTPGGSDRLLIGVMATGDVSAATHTGMDHPAAGGALTAVGSAVALGTHGRSSVWRLISPAASSATTKGVWGSSQGESAIGGIAYSGVDQTTPIKLSSIVTNTGTVTATTAFTATVNVATVAGEKVFAFAFFHETSAMVNPGATEGAGCTPVYDIEGTQMGGFGACMAVERTASGTSTTMSVDFSAAVNMNGHWSIHAFVINAAAGGGVAKGPPPQLLRNRAARLAVLMGF